MDALLTWEGTLHTFGGGATGWSFFYTDNFDDPGKILALSTATALAAPFEDELLDGGMPLISTALQVVEGELRAWSGVELPTSHWKGRPDAAVGRHIHRQPAQNCEVRRNEVHRV